MSQVYLRELVLTVGGVDYSTSVKNPRLYSKQADTSDVTLAEARLGGGNDEYLAFEFLQNTVQGSIMRKILDSAGSEATFALRTINSDEDYMTGTVIISRGTSDFTLFGGGDTTSDPKKRAWSAVEWKLKGSSSRVAGS